MLSLPNQAAYSDLVVPEPTRLPKEVLDQQTFLVEKTRDFVLWSVEYQQRYDARVQIRLQRVAIETRFAAGDGAIVFYVERSEVRGSEGETIFVTKPPDLVSSAFSAQEAKDLFAIKKGSTPQGFETFSRTIFSSYIVVVSKDESGDLVLSEQYERPVGNLTDPKDRAISLLLGARGRQERRMVYRSQLPPRAYVAADARAADPQILLAIELQVRETERRRMDEQAAAQEAALREASDRLRQWANGFQAEPMHGPWRIDRDRGNPWQNTIDAATDNAHGSDKPKHAQEKPDVKAGASQKPIEIRLK